MNSDAQASKVVVALTRRPALGSSPGLRRRREAAPSQQDPSNVLLPFSLILAASEANHVRWAENVLTRRKFSGSFLKKVMLIGFGDWILESAARRRKDPLSETYARS